VSINGRSGGNNRPLVERLSTLTAVQLADAVTDSLSRRYSEARANQTFIKKVCPGQDYDAVAAEMREMVARKALSLMPEPVAVVTVSPIAIAAVKVDLERIVSLVV
jgi:hypothetical protein